MAEQNQDEYAYAVSPASRINLNINLTELPKCTEPNCNGVYVPLQSTTRSKTGVSTIIVIGWVCLSCGHNTMYDLGKLLTQTVIKETESPL
jgi:RNase P subunit RPR2